MCSISSLLSDEKEVTSSIESIVIVIEKEKDAKECFTQTSARRSLKVTGPSPEIGPAALSPSAQPKMTARVRDSQVCKVRSCRTLWGAHADVGLQTT